MVATGTNTESVFAGMVTVVVVLVKSAAPAVPVVVVKVTVVGVALKPESETVKLTGLPSVALAGAIDTVGMASSSTIVPTPNAVVLEVLPLVIFAVRLKVSLPS